ncbi:hypothetical protein HZB02_03835 [Candidatus Woesearchaeota archaeon]|nr:hypothetical protein [Candidatus Woesearchaeota archaeon]
MPTEKQTSLVQKEKKENDSPVIPAPDTSSEMRLGNISIILDSYDDLFSDFDPRPYTVRTISDDFLHECRRAVRDKKSEGVELELQLLVPKNKRNAEYEVSIKRRLKTYFQKQWEAHNKELKTIQHEGMIWSAVGILLIFFSTLLLNHETFFARLLFVIAEPGGWFSIWTGLEKLFFGGKDKMSEATFNQKMGQLKVIFQEY